MNLAPPRRLSIDNSRNAERQDAENAEYRQRMVVNAVAASFITLMIVTGCWIVSTLVQVS
jgi:hypothetical protein